MEPMKPMEPMRPMQPLGHTDRWWPDGLGEPSATGAQDGVRYAFFPDGHRLLVERDGAVNAYDTGARSITGVQAGGGKLVFTAEDGPVDLDTLRQVR